MRIVLRADAGAHRGTGHVMRALALGEELALRGHDAVLAGSLGDVAWLAERVDASPVRHVESPSDELDEAVFEGADRAVIDSYLIDADAIGALGRTLPVLAVVDGGDRGIDAALYLDPTPGAAVAEPSGSNRLTGARYVLVRREVLALRRETPRPIDPHPRIVVFMGGTDPTGALEPVTDSIARAIPDAELVPVGALAFPGAIAPTPDLPRLLADADLVVCAAGTSAWDVCTLGVPAVLVAVAENQRPGLAFARDAGLAGAVDGDRLDAVGAEAALALGDDTLRAARFARCRELFDGRGAERVADALLGLDSSTAGAASPESPPR
ncbi:MAG: hypothetical protein KF727_02620 [Microbacteriaceae bacterium]|nr:hypothetical protein [Microbacteriaceae bacterium]